MLVARLHGVHDIRLSDEPPPVPSDGRSLVRVTAVGLCGSDLHWYREAGIGDAQLTRPLVIGHEFAGVVESGPLIGRRVAADPAVPCGHCEVCLSGDRNLCPMVVSAGHGTQDGALREYIDWPTDLLHPVPDSLDDADAAMLEPLGVAIHSQDLGHVRTAASVGVFGCGPIGLLLIQVARATGAATIVAVDPLPHRREAAKQFGADLVLSPEQARQQGAFAPVVAGLGVDVAFDVSGTDDAVDLAMRAARPGARVVLAGIPDSDTTTFRASLARRKGLTLVMVRRMKEVYPRAIALVERGLVDVRSVVSHRYPLSQVEDAFTTASARAGLKVVVQPSG